jgi:stage V sporulation protein G
VEGSQLEITEVRVKLVNNPNDKLRGFCSVTFDQAFVVRDLKIIEGTQGLFVAMPSRKLCDRCARCGGKNHLRARYCNDCGLKLAQDRAPRDERGRDRLHADISHPIHARAREKIHASVLDAFAEELEKSKLEGYRPPRFDDMDYDV